MPGTPWEPDPQTQFLTQLQADLKYVMRTLDEMRTEMKEDRDKAERNFVTREEFKALEERTALLWKLVYGVVSVIGLSFLGALVNSVMKQPAVK